MCLCSHTCDAKEESGNSTKCKTKAGTRSPMDKTQDSDAVDAGSGPVGCI